MRKEMTILIAFLVTLGPSCRQKIKVGTYEEMKKELKGVELERSTPYADPSGFESEMNNGGLNQYFFNSAGQNSFETLRYFKQHGKIKEASILEEGLKLINPKNIPESELLENLRKRMVIELDDSTVNSKLDSLDKEYYK